MKANLKDAGKIKLFLLTHGEKLGVAIVAGIAGWLLYSSLGIPGEDRKPTELSSLVTQAKNKVDQFSREDALQEPGGFVVASAFEAVADEPVPTPSYSPDRLGWNPPVVPPTVLRKDPLLLAPADLRGHGGTELMGFIDEDERRRRELEELKLQRATEAEREKLAAEAAEEAERGRRGRGREDELLEDKNRRPIVGNARRGGLDNASADRIELTSYAMVVAKVPVEDQVRIYQDAFENALGFDETRDLPQYLGYFVERQDVSAKDDAPWEKIKLRNGTNSRTLKAVTSNAIDMAIGDWASTLEEIADTRFFHSVLTFPLPPIVGREWGREAIYSEVPLAIETERKMQEMQEMEPEVPVGDEDGGPDFGLGDGAGLGPGRGGPGRRGGRMSGGYGGMEMEMGMGGGGRSRGASRSRGRGGMARGGGDDTSYETPFLMLRFVDFSVAPGKRYKYRVQLVMLDPNGGLSRSYREGEVNERLKKSEKAADEAVRKNRNPRPFIRLTEWSDASETISIPLAGGVNIASVKPAPTKGFNGEPSIGLMVQSFDLDEKNNAIEAYLEKSLQRGSVVNFKEEAEFIDGRFLVKKEDFNFRTDIVVLDVRGGDKISRDAAIPGQALVMDAAGKLSVRNELEDSRDVEEARLLYTEDENAVGPGGGGGGGGRGYEGDFDIGF